MTRRKVHRIEKILKSKRELEIEVQADGSIKAVPRGTKQDAILPQRPTINELLGNGQ